jgi:phosphinothricin acetyltransferase
MSPTIRDATALDVPALAAIYAHHVLHGFGTFDAVPPTIAEFDATWRGIVALGLPFLVADVHGEVVGYSYASQFRPRPGYRYTIEDSVYIRDDQRGHGIGSALLGPLLARCEAVGARQVVAVIGDSLNAGSIGLHRKFGFDHSGTVRSAGFKHGRWVDIVMMQKATNGGDRTLPPATGAWVVP